MGRSSQDILADKILAETGNSLEKHAARQRLMQDQEDYVRERALEHQLRKEEEENLRKKLNLSKAEWAMRNFINGISVCCISLGPVGFFISLFGIEWLLYCSIITFVIGCVLGVVSYRKFERGKDF